MYKGAIQMSQDRTQNLQMWPARMSEPNSSYSNITFSCEKNTIGLNQPKGKHFTSLGLWQRRDKLVEELR